MTIGGWICFAFFVALLISGAFLVFISSENIAVRIAVSALCALAVIGLLIGMLWYFGNTASGQRAMVDQQSDLGNGLDRIVRVYTANGDIIAEFEGDRISHRWADWDHSPTQNIVRWENNSCGFEPFSDSEENCHHCVGGLPPDDCEVIGTVCDEVHHE